MAYVRHPIPERLVIRPRTSATLLFAGHPAVAVAQLMKTVIHQVPCGFLDNHSDLNDAVTRV